MIVIEGQGDKGKKTNTWNILKLSLI
jgi:hypothetical protein